MEIGLLTSSEEIIKVPFLDGKIHMLFVPSDEISDLLKQATEKTWDRKHQQSEEINVIKYRKLLGRRCVRGWEGYTMNKKPYAYTPENCDMLMTKWADFALCVGNSCSDLQVLMEGERAEAEKK